ncbi:Panacea domain-containing protein [Alicyclobacillus fodiniaquatilis]|uniref:Panacea domain-containing protein n=1 Tax=Alicyclobacillus fodiniaquatilis TaxID=1661150 RepID=A0ABW4JGE5_9BACL
MALVTDVANYFREQLYASEGSSLTHLKLQKLTYYAQAWSLVLLGRPLFNGEFEAWAHGPVNRHLYAQYRDYGWQNIKPIKPEEQFISSEDIFDEDEMNVLSQVWEIYGDYDAKYLERLTHQEFPWIEARDGLPDGAYCDTIIDQSTMKQFYTGLLEDAQ